MRYIDWFILNKFTLIHQSFPRKFECVAMTTTHEERKEIKRFH